MVAIKTFALMGIYFCKEMGIIKKQTKNLKTRGKDYFSASVFEILALQWTKD